MTITTIVLIAIVAILACVLFSIIRMILKVTFGLVGFSFRIITLPYRLITATK